MGEVKAFRVSSLSSKRKRERSSQRERAMSTTVDDYEWTQNLSQEVCGVIISCGTKVRAVPVHVRHASVEVQVQCVNVVIGVVLGELLVVRVVPVVVCDDALVRRTLVLIAFHRSQCFHRRISVAIFLFLEV